MDHQQLIEQARHDLCTEQEVVNLVHRFYQQARLDPQLATVFGPHVHDWDAHLKQLVDFWSGLLRGSGRYSGQPMPQHLALPVLSQALFARWLALFFHTTGELGNEAMKRKADALAVQIAERLWLHYQRHHWPERAPTTVLGPTQ